MFYSCMMLQKPDPQVVLLHLIAEAKNQLLDRVMNTTYAGYSLIGKAHYLF